MVDKNILDRKSIVCFDSRPIERVKLKNIFEAARWAPSSFNHQPWRFIVGEKNDEAYDKILLSLSPTNKIWASNAPVLVISVAHMVIGLENTINKYAWHDTAMAYSNLVFQAISVGLMAHPMGGFSSSIIRENFDIPIDFEPVIAFALGYASECNDMPIEVLERSKRVRVRKPIEEFVYGSNWSVPFL